MQVNHPSLETAPSDFTRTTRHPFADTLSRVQEAAKAQGFRVSHVHDLAAAMKGGGFEREPYAVVELCRADIAYGVLRQERIGAPLNSIRCSLLISPS